MRKHLSDSTLIDGNDTVLVIEPRSRGEVQTCKVDSKNINLGTQDCLIC